MNDLALFGLLAAAVSQAAWIVADSDLFLDVRYSFEGWAGSKDRPLLRYWSSRITDGIGCAACVGMWFSLLAAGMLRPDFLPGGAWTSVPVYALGLALAARAMHWAIQVCRNLANRLDEEE